jgi:hypothetical protein
VTSRFDSVGDASLEAPEIEMGMNRLPFAASTGLAYGRFYFRCIHGTQYWALGLCFNMFLRNNLRHDSRPSFANILCVKERRNCSEGKIREKFSRLRLQFSKKPGESFSQLFWRALFLQILVPSQAQAHR